MGPFLLQCHLTSVTVVTEFSVGMRIMVLQPVSTLVVVAEPDYPGKGTRADCNVVLEHHSQISG